MTRTNRFSIIYEQIRIKLTKKAGAQLVPQVLPGIQVSEVSMQSYIILFQSSPVAILISIIIALPKLLKLLSSLIASP